MIDYLKVSATSAHYDNIDLLEKDERIDVSKVSSPNDIRNRKKVEYVPRTIRINEFTDASLRAMAEECDMSINNVINLILSEYVNAYQGEIGSGYMKERVLNYYLDRMMSDKHELARILSEDKKWKIAIERENEPEVLETGDVYVMGFWREFFNVTIYAPSDSEEASYKRLDDKYKKQHEDTFSSDFVLSMPEKKWYTVMSVFTRYVSKCHVLGLKRELDEESMKKLVDIINNSKTDKTLIRNLINGLKHSHEPGRAREGSIWSWMF